MKKGYIIGEVVGVILLIGIVFGVSSYNGFVDARENIDTNLAEIDVQLERRADLIPNLVNTVKGYVEHEEATINNITEARENLLKASNVEEKAEANAKLDNALNALLVIVENYPDLKANQNFINLQDELAGTENRIANARRNYNEVVGSYNKKTKRFPQNIVAGMFNFEEAPYFVVDDSKKDVPSVDFN